MMKDFILLMGFVVAGGSRGHGRHGDETGLGERETR
jgi:hypothetical protein